MNIQEYANYMLTHIKPIAKLSSGGRVINCRCFYCPDSKNPNHAHMYLGLGQKNEHEPLWFSCQKCKTQGLVTPNKLMEWNIYDPEVASFVSQYNKQALSLGKNMSYRGMTVYNIDNTMISLDDNTDKKLEYINSRLGVKLDYSDCVDLKIVLNIRDILKRNNLRLTRDSRIVSALDQYFVGFLSHDNAFLNLRKVDSLCNQELYQSINKRYVNYNIFNKFDNTHRFYSIPTRIDLLDPSPVHLHIAEGVFDILSIYLNIVKTRDRNIFTSIGGSSYLQVIRYFIFILKIPNIIIHIYPDNDISSKDIQEVVNSLYTFRFKIFIHRNVFPNEKDFGVPINRINESIEEVI